jgi:hypothetical protein
MIQLRSNYLQIQSETGDLLPCSAEHVSVELLGEACYQLDPVMVQHAAEAVLHYFRHDMGREKVSVAEFSEALEKALRGMGVSVQAATAPVEEGAISELDLRAMAEDSDSMELAFFKNLHQALDHQLAATPRVIRFTGLRSSVKCLRGVKRWNPGCQQLNDQIVIYLRRCWEEEGPDHKTTLVIR